MPHFRRRSTCTRRPVFPRETPFGVAEHVIPALAAQLHRAERTALIRQLQSLSGRSKIGRVITQIGQQGRQVWTNLKTEAQTGAARAVTSRPTGARGRKIG